MDWLVGWSVGLLARRFTRNVFEESPLWLWAGIAYRGFIITDRGRFDRPSRSLPTAGLTARQQQLFEHR